LTQPRRRGYISAQAGRIVPAQSNTLDVHDKEGLVMKKLVLLALLVASSVLSTGCGATPAYSGRERSRMIARNWGYEFRQANDDIDHLLLLRGGGGLTKWNVQASD
jgi:hypothetical protein